MSVQLGKVRLNILLLVLILSLIFSAIGIFDQQYNSWNIANFLTGNFLIDNYIYIIGFPHIITSFVLVGFISGKSIYKESKILNFKIVILTLIFFASKNTFLVLFYFFISQHVVGQMIKPLKKWLNLQDHIVNIWCYILTVSMMVSFLNIYSGDIKLFLHLYLSDIYKIGWIFILISWCYIFYNFTQIYNLKRGLIILSIQIYFTNLYYFSMSNNLVFWGGLFLIGHDLLAFYYYYNSGINFFGNFWKSIGVIFLGYILSFSLIYLFIFLKIVDFTLLLQIFHYSLEQTIWKKNGSARSFLNFETIK